MTKQPNPMLLDLAEQPDSRALGLARPKARPKSIGSAWAARPT